MEDDDLGVKKWGPRRTHVGIEEAKQSGEELKFDCRIKTLDSFPCEDKFLSAKESKCSNLQGPAISPLFRFMIIIPCLKSKFPHTLQHLLIKVLSNPIAVIGKKLSINPIDLVKVLPIECITTISTPSIKGIKSSS
ncbi:hypothetical protein VNO80_29404 [Phaseolus coccineus]|uniref:Uncharacterized protein n=1 Tax=Phaseolus coccineus TaxID=3886 RepID=A0AAN9LEA8_PHACN